MRTITLALASLLCGTGCAQLQAKVSIYDRQCFAESGLTAEALSQAVAKIMANRTQDRYSQVINSLQTDLRKHVATLADKGIIESGEQARMISDLQRLIQDRIALARENHDRGVQAYFESESLMNTKQRLEKLHIAQSLIEEGDRNLETLVADLIKESRDSKETQLTNLGQQETLQLLFKRTVTKSLDPLEVGFAVAGDPLISQIVYSKGECWKGAYNKTFGSGAFGNTDIAIKVDGQREYTLKGLRLDSTKVTQAFFKTIHQAIQLTAAAYGVPVSGRPSSPQDGMAIDEDVLQADQRKAEADAARRISRSSALAILEAIVSQRKDLDQENSWKAAVSMIKTTYAVHKPNLVPPSGSNPP